MQILVTKDLHKVNNYSKRLLNARFVHTMTPTTYPKYHFAKFLFGLSI